VVTKLDRLGRSLEHLIDLSKGLQANGVDLVVLDQGIDTSTAIGRMFFQILGAIAGFEHALMSERTIDGLAAAQARGRTGGQKPKLTPRQARIAQQMYDETGPDGKRRYTVAPDRRRVRRHPAHYLPAPLAAGAQRGPGLAGEPDRFRYVRVVGGGLQDDGCRAGPLRRHRWCARRRRPTRRRYILPAPSGRG
jgi:hypothetical protein